MINPSDASQHPVITKTAPASDGFFKSFVTHPASVGESYVGHFVFALKFGFRLVFAGFLALVHAFIPAWFETAASEQVEKLHAELSARHSAPRQILK